MVQAEMRLIFFGEEVGNSFASSSANNFKMILRFSSSVVSASSLR
jgi:hypothetical protein